MPQSNSRQVCATLDRALLDGVSAIMLRYRFCFCVLCAILGAAVCLGILFLSAPAVSAQAPAAARGGLSFVNDVAPILKENCFACHDSKKRKGKMDMTTFESFRKGGTREDPIVPGKPDESLIIELLTAQDKSRMPPKEAGDALPKEKIAVIAKWIAEGAKLDPGLTPKSDLLRELRVRWQPPPPPSVYPYPVTVTALAFTPDNQKLVIGGQHELTVWDFARGKLEKRIFTRAERAYAMAFLPDGKLAVAGGRPGQEGDVRVYNLQGSKGTSQNGVTVLDGVNDKNVMVKQLLDTDDSVLCLAASPNGKRLASGGCDRIVNIWDISGGVMNAKLDQSIENHADWVFGVVFAADGKHLLTCSRDKTAKVWDLSTRESVLTFPDHQSPVYGVAVTPDGKTGISAGEDNQVRFWNTTGDGKQTRALAGHSKAIFRVLYHPRQPLVLTCSADSSVRVWNADKGQAVRTLTGNTDWTYALAVSPEGNQVASGSWNGEIRIWKIADGQLLQTFNASPGLAQAAVLIPRK
jgi:WD40 repeat protein